MARQMRAARRETQQTNQRRNSEIRRDKKQSGRSYGASHDPKQVTFEPMNERQRLAYKSLFGNFATFLTGPAGTAKTHISVAAGLNQLLTGEVDYMYFTKPFFEIDAPLGILPGGVDEKTELLSKSMYSLAEKLLGKSHFEYFLRMEKIKFLPMGHILGLNMERALVMIDEAQNTTPGQMKALLSRLHDTSRISICGDYVEQVYIKGRNGLEDAIKRFANAPGFNHIEFDEDDIVRGRNCKTVVLAYRRDIYSKVIRTQTVLEEAA